MLIQYWNGGITENSHAYIELNFNIYAKDPSEQVTVDLSKFMNSAPKVVEEEEVIEEIVEEIIEDEKLN